MGAAEHWESIYSTKAPDAVSWYRPHLDMSLSLITGANQDLSAGIVDVGGGESTLAADLASRGHRNITVLDVSRTALNFARHRCPSPVHWVCADVLRLPFAANSFDLWHDRAVFHFLTDPVDRAAYVEQLTNAVRPGGHVIVGGFGPEGPEQCSGLPVVRYDSTGLHTQFGSRFRLMHSAIETHLTPWGAPQQFLYCYCRVS